MSVCKESKWALWRDIRKKVGIAMEELRQSSTFQNQEADLLKVDDVYSSIDIAEKNEYYTRASSSSVNDNCMDSEFLNEIYDVDDEEEEFHLDREESSDSELENNETSLKDNLLLNGL